LRKTNAGAGARGNETREHLLDVAARLFAAHGYSGTGLRQLASEAGMSLSMVNYHFGSKRAVLEELLDQLFAAWLEATARALEGEATLEGKVRGYVRTLVRLARERPDAMRIAFAEHPNEVPGLGALKSARLAAIGALLQRHLASSRLPLHIVAPAMASAAYSHFLVRPLLVEAMGPLPDDDAFFDRYADQIADLLLRGLAGKT
jgi:AcrR family transcriptional regulator